MIASREGLVGNGWLPAQNGRRRPYQTCVIAKFGQQELNARRKSLFVNFVNQILLNQVPVIAGKATGKDHGFGIIEVCQVGYADTHVARCAQIRAFAALSPRRANSETSSGLGSESMLGQVPLVNAS